MKTDSNDQISFEGIPAALLAEFPTLRVSYDALRARYSGELDKPWFVTAVVSDVLGPYLDSLLIEGDEDRDLRRVMGFIERLASHPDVNVRGVVATELAYPLFGPGREELLERARLFMGPATLDLLSDQERLATRAPMGLLDRLSLPILRRRNKVRVLHGRNERRQGR